MADLFTYIVYLGLLLFLVIGTVQLKSRSKVAEITIIDRFDFRYYFIIIVLAFIVGVRYQVGIDWPGYVNIFQDIAKTNSSISSDSYVEWGYFWINRVISNLGLSYHWMFFVISFITWYFYFRAVPRIILPLFLFFIFATDYFFWGMNGVRQFMAMGIWLFSVRFIVLKDFKRYIIFILLASLFHKSVLFLMIFYFIPFAKLYNSKIWFYTFCFSLIFVFFIDLKGLQGYISNLTFWIGQYSGTAENYSRYISSDKLVERQTEVGLGFYFNLLTNGFLIFYSKDIIKKHTSLKIYYVLFFVGAIIFNLFYDFQLIGRINNYFLILKPILLAYTVYYFWNKNKLKQLLAIGLVVLYCFLLVVAIYNGSNGSSPYQFQF